MINWCHQEVIFKGQVKTIEKLKDKLIKMQNDQRKWSSSGQKFHKSSGKYFFNIYIVESINPTQTKLKVSFRTKSSPAIYGIYNYCIKNNVEFTMRYGIYESNNFCMIKLSNCQLKCKQLSQDQIDQVIYDSDEELYIYDDRSSTDPSDFYYEMFSDKKWEDMNVDNLGLYE